MGKGKEQYLPGGRRMPAKYRQSPTGLADFIDSRIQDTIATPFTGVTATILAEVRDEVGLPKDEFLAFVKRNLEEYNKLVLESLEDKL